MSTAGCSEHALASDSTQRGPRAGDRSMPNAWLRAVNMISDDDKATRPLITKEEMGDLDEGLTIVRNGAGKGG